MTLITNIVSYWKLDESSGNATDQVSSNTLTNNNTATYSSGKINNGVNVARASSQWLSITNGTQVGLGITGNLTIAGWIKFSSLPTGLTYCMASKDATGNRGYSLNIATTTLQFSVNVTTAAVTWSPSTSTWYHVAIVYTAAGGTADFYINGSQQGTQQSGLPTSIPTNTTTFNLGNDGFASLFDGSFDEFGVWSRSLSGSEISSLYNSGTGIQYPFGLGSGGSFLLNFI